MEGCNEETMEILETQNLILKPYEEKYAEKTHENFFCQEETAKYMLWKPTQTTEEAKERLERWSNNWKYFWIIHDKTTDEPIGFLGTDEVEPNIYGHLGLCVGLEYKGKGYGSQVLKKCIDYLSLKGATEIRYSHFKENIASQKLAEKMGFQFVKEGMRTRAWDNKEFKEYFYLLKIQQNS